MDKNAFFERIAARLGRPPIGDPPERSVVGMPARDPGRAEDRPRRFAAELEAVGGRVHRVRDLAEAHALLLTIWNRFRVRRAVAWARSEFEAWDLDWLFLHGAARAYGDPGLSGPRELRAALLSAHLGLTTADFGIAETGSLLVSASRTRPRAVSLLPPLHVALLKTNQLVDTLGQALERFSTEGMPSTLHSITGPSRTSDIENDLTIGVHGPAAVEVILLGKEA